MKTALLLAMVIVSWGLNWTVTKVVIVSIAPLWATAIRALIATATLFAVQSISGHLTIPRRGDIPVVLVITVFHMVAFAVLTAYGLKFVPVGRSVLLGYTTSFWVVPLAWLFLGEPLRLRQLAGVAVGLVGLLVMFNPLAVDWDDRATWIGHGLILLAALCWAVSIVFIRGHVWISSPFQLALWQTLLASAVLTALAWMIDGPPHIDWTPALLGYLLYGGVIGTALAYWAMTVVNRSLPAVTVSLGVLATPVVGAVSAALCTGEVIETSVVAAMVLILTGIAIGTRADDDVTRVS